MNACTVSSVVFLCAPPVLAFAVHEMLLGVSWYMVGIASILNHHRKNYSLAQRDPGQRVCFVIDHVCIVWAASVNVVRLALTPAPVMLGTYVCLLALTFGATQIARGRPNFEYVAVSVHAIGAITNVGVLWITFCP